MIHNDVHCMCNSPEHVLAISIDDAREFAYISMELNPYLPWYKRVYYGLAYIFNIATENSAYDGTMLSVEGAKAVIDTLSELQPRNSELAV